MLTVKCQPLGRSCCEVDILYEWLWKLVGGVRPCLALREEKATYTYILRSGFLADIPDAYARPAAWMSRGQKVSPHRRDRRRTNLSVRTSTIFGADVHDPNRVGKVYAKIVWSDFGAPYQTTGHTVVQRITVLTVLVGVTGQCR